jgi:serine/threonine protein kinase
MSLAHGTRLGSYEVLDLLGKGGMGEVYRALDHKLGPEVALKLLPEHLAGDAERLARFEREARILASLNHSNVATLHGLEESGGWHFLIMELVPGETLAERLKRGRLSLEEALPLFQQIAHALEAAHEKGVIHRDLKPANIKVTEDGKVSVLDFGLAKVFEETPLSSDLSHSPTVTREGTRVGTVMGTAAYMSPEQTRGKRLDRRSDLWAFGCCLFEALSGSKAFDGETVTDVFAAIVRGEPEWSRLPGDVPDSLRLLLQRCLTKDPAHRPSRRGRRRHRDRGSPGAPDTSSGKDRVSLDAGVGCLRGRGGSRASARGRHGRKAFAVQASRLQSRPASGRAFFQ